MKVYIDISAAAAPQGDAPMSDGLSDFEDLTSAQYQAAMQRLCLLGQLLDLDELRWMAATIDRCHSVGPILYPTEYKRALGSGTLDAQKRLLDACTALRVAFDDVQAAQS